MAVLNEEEAIAYSFEWKIESISYSWHNADEKIVSPAFVLDRFENTKWTLNLYPRVGKSMNYIGFYLKRIDAEGPKTIEVQYELQFLTGDGKCLKGYMDPNAVFGKNMDMGYEEFIKRRTVFIDKREVYLPNDTLTALCIIRSKNERAKLIKKFFARTVIKVNRTSFYWNIERFTKLECNQNISHTITSLKNEDLLTCNFYLSEQHFPIKSANLSITVHDNKIKYLIFKVFLIDNSGERVECGDEEFFFNDLSQHTSFLLYFTKNFITENRNKYLEEGDLHLLCECTYTTGFAFQATETIDFGVISSKSHRNAFERVNNKLEQPTFSNITFRNNVYLRFWLTFVFYYLLLHLSQLLTSSSTDI